MAATTGTVTVAKLGNQSVTLPIGKENIDASAGSDFNRQALWLISALIDSLTALAAVVEAGGHSTTSVKIPPKPELDETVTIA